MNQYGSDMLYNGTNIPLCDAVLMMGVNPAVADLLIIIETCIMDLIASKYTIISVIVANRMIWLTRSMKRVPEL
jgi:hypothetical protein